MKRLEKIVGSKTLNKDIVKTAFTHSSYANEKGFNNNERLEYLGDAVLELCMSSYLYKNFDFAEGEMTKKRAQAVCEEALIKYATYIGLSEYLLLGKGEELSGGRKRPAIIADAFEALLGAIFLLKGMEGATDFFNKAVIPVFKDLSDIRDFKSTLQEYIQSVKKTLVYNVDLEEGPSHDRLFSVSVLMGNVVLGRGVGKTKKEAEQNAAKEALDRKA